MTKQACLAVVLAMFSGCGGSAEKDIDIDPDPIQCNPDTQTGCDTGQKCASVTVSEDPTLIVRTACVPNGTVVLGGECDVGVAGEETGYDNCAAGFHCLSGVCQEVCARNGATDTCAESETQNCVQFADLFDDVDDAQIGLCATACNPVAQDCADVTQGCYLNLTTAESSCADIPMGSRTKLQDDDCFGPAAGECFLNGCPKGYGALLPDDSENGTTAVCAGFCNPIETHTAATGGGLGDPAGIDCSETFGDANRPDNGTGPNAPYQCRFIQAFYNDAEAVPVTTGFCVSTSEWGNCDSCDITNADTFAATCSDLNIFGCVNFATLSAVPPGPTLTVIGDVLGRKQKEARAFGLDLSSLPGIAYGMSL